MKFSEALTKYLAFGQFKNKRSSMSSYFMHIRHLVLYFRDCDLEKVKLEDIIDYMDLMIKIGWDKNSLVAKASAYKQFFLFFQSQGIVKFDAHVIPVPNPEPKFPKIIEEAEYKKLLAVLEQRTRPHIKTLRGKLLLHLLWDTGMRLNELRSLKIKDLDVDKMRTTIKTEKSRGIRPMRMVFWTKETNRILKDFLIVRENYLKQKKQESEFLWVTVYNRWIQGAVWSETAIEQFMKELSIKADLGFVANPHRFRHHFGRKLALQGANNSVISDMMGHASIESTRIYTVMNEEMMDNTYRKHFKA